MDSAQHPYFLKPSPSRFFSLFLEQHFPHLLRRYKERFEKKRLSPGSLSGDDRKSDSIRYAPRHQMKSREMLKDPTADQLSLFESIK